MAQFIMSDRGPTFTLVCMAVSFGIVCGCFVIPGLILSLYAASIVYTAVSYVFAESFALLIGMSVYYTGVFLTSVVAPVVYNYIYDPVVIALDAVSTGIMTGVYAITSTIYQGFWSVVGYATIE